MKPFIEGRKSSGKPALAASAIPPVRLPGMVRPAACADRPSVEAIKEGDKIVRLIVRCACGERIEVECLYGS